MIMSYGTERSLVTVRLFSLIFDYHRRNNFLQLSLVDSERGGRDVRPPPQKGGGGIERKLGKERKERGGVQPLRINFS